MEIGDRAIQTTEKANMKHSKIGSDFDDFLASEGLLEEVTALGVKRVIAWQNEQEIQAQKINKSTIAKKNAHRPRVAQSPSRGGQSAASAFAGD
jgi:hypothetical protein